MGFTGEEIYLTNSIFLFVAWIGLAVLIWTGMERVDWKDLRANLLALLLAVVFSVCMAVGADLDSMEYVVFGDIRRIVSICCFAMALTVIIREVWSCMDNDRGNSSFALEEGYSRGRFMVIAVVLDACLSGIVSWFFCVRCTG